MIAFVRVGDRERERAQQRLRSSYLRGELSEETFEARVSAALLARCAAELEALRADIPTRADRLSHVIRARIGRWAAADDRPSLVAPEALPGACLLLGRALHCDVRFTTLSISRRHAELRRVPAGWLLVDRASTNGTWVNGRRVQRTHVGDGDEICLGDFCMVLRT
jgi:hypothetical protein